MRLKLRQKTGEGFVIFENGQPRYEIRVVNVRGKLVDVAFVDLPNEVRVQRTDAATDEAGRPCRRPKQSA